MLTYPAYLKTVKAWLSAYEGMPTEQAGLQGRYEYRLGIEEACKKHHYSLLKTVPTEQFDASKALPKAKFDARYTQLLEDMDKANGGTYKSFSELPGLNKALIMLGTGLSLIALTLGTIMIAGFWTVIATIAVFFAAIHIFGGESGFHVTVSYIALFMMCWVVSWGSGDGLEAYWPACVLWAVIALPLLYGNFVKKGWWRTRSAPGVSRKVMLERITQVRADIENYFAWHVIHVKEQYEQSLHVSSEQAKEVAEKMGLGAYRWTEIEEAIIDNNIKPGNHTGLQSLGFIRRNGEMTSSDEDIEWAFDISRARNIILLSDPVVMPAEDNPNPSKPVTLQQALAQSLACRLLISHKAGDIKFSIYDPQGIGALASDFSPLMDAGLGESFLHTSQLESHLKDLQLLIQRRLTLLGGNKYSSLAEYNRMNPFSAEPMHMLFVQALPEQTPESVLALLETILSNGPDVGVHALVCLSSAMIEQTNSKALCLHQYFPLGMLIDSREQPRGWMHVEAFGEEARACLEYPSKALVRSLSTLVAQQSSSRANAALDIRGLMPDQPQSGDATHGISVDLGRAGDETVTMTFGGTRVSALVGGKTGSGKSNLLNVIVTGLAAKYSPSELQFLLLDFKTSGFRQYLPGSDDHTFLPHARIISEQADRAFGTQTLNYLLGEIQRRNDSVFPDAGASDYEQYRSKVAKPLPRLLCILDEFQVLIGDGDDAIGYDAVSLLSNIAKLGRSAGVHLLLASQTLTDVKGGSRFTAMLEQFATRVALQTSTKEASALLLGDKNYGATTLSRQGQAIFTTNTTSSAGNKEFRVAYADSDALLDMRKKLMKTYPGKKPGLRFAGNRYAQLSDTDFSHLPASQTMFALGQPVSIDLPLHPIATSDLRGNLALVGQNEQAALGIIESSVRMYARSHPGAPIIFAISPASSSREHVLHVVDTLTTEGIPCQVMDDVQDNPKELEGFVSQGMLIGVDWKIGDDYDRRDQLNDFFAARPAGITAIMWWRYGHNLTGLASKNFGRRVCFDGRGEDLLLDWFPRLPSQQDMRANYWGTEKPGQLTTFVPYNTTQSLTSGKGHDKEWLE